MIKETFQYLIGLGNVQRHTIEGVEYSTQPLHRINESTVDAIELNSLAGLVGYIQSGFDGPYYSSLMVHIESPTLVSVYSHLNRDLNRSVLIRAKALLPQFRFGSWTDAETFNISLQSMFVSNEDRATMLKVVGNIKDEHVTSFGDDGVSQQVQAKAGVATVANVKVPNPVYLKPFRTFVEVEQPESAFVFRMRSGPECALFEADGGAWKVEAVDTVREFLETALEERINSGDIVLIS